MALCQNMQDRGQCTSRAEYVIAISNFDSMLVCGQHLRAELLDAGPLNQLEVARIDSWQQSEAVLL